MLLVGGGVGPERGTGLVGDCPKNPKPDPLPGACGELGGDCLWACSSCSCVLWGGGVGSIVVTPAPGRDCLNDPKPDPPAPGVDCCSSGWLL
jgi:hypothetical protein